MEPYPPCRLCSGLTTFRFERQILGTYDVAYYECSQCGSLQTDPPRWLPEAYSDPALGLDVGRAQRVVMTSLVSVHILEQLGVPKDRPSIDWGGSEGLFTRFMRDRGFNFRSYDKYREPFYAEHFSVNGSRGVNPAALTLFEVLEHLPNPHEDLREIFSLQPDVLIFSTEMYRRQGPDWIYLGFQEGKHVFFYSHEALAWIAEEHGYEFEWLDTVGVYASKRLLEAGGEAREGWNRLRENPGSILADAASAYVGHLTGDPWKHVHADFELVASALSRRKPVS